MKVRIDADVCAGFGICTGLSPEVFELHEDGYATVRVDLVPAELEELVQRALDQCPTQAISISDDWAD